jgi:ribonuclease D
MSSPAEMVVATPAELADCCAHLAQCSQVGFDTEFVGEDSYHPSLCLIQVATADALYLIDPFISGPLDAFWQVLLAPSRTVVVHAGREEVRLCHRHTGRTPPGLFDLQIAAGLVGIGYPMGYGPLVHQVLGRPMAKGETLTEWRSRPLTAGQLCYAFDDVRYLLPLWQNLHGRLAELGRVDWAQEEFARLAEVVTPAEEGQLVHADKWRKLRGLGSLDRRRLAIARELFHWREEEAAQSNRPPRTLVRDDLLVEIARRNPKTQHDVQVVRGLARRVVPGIWQAIERARNLPADEHPELAEREQDPAQMALLVNVLSAALADYCMRNALAPALVSTNQDLRLLIRSRLANDPALASLSQLAGGWRATHILPPLSAILDGRRAFRIADIRSETPFAYIDLDQDNVV